MNKQHISHDKYTLIFVKNIAQKLDIWYHRS